MAYFSRKYCNTHSFALPYYGYMRSAFPFSQQFPPRLLREIDEVITGHFDELNNMRLRYISNAKATENCDNHFVKLATPSMGAPLTLGNMLGLGLVMFVGVCMVSATAVGEYFYHKLLPTIRKVSTALLKKAISVYMRRSA